MTGSKNLTLGFSNQDERDRVRAMLDEATTAAQKALGDRPSLTQLIRHWAEHREQLQALIDESERFLPSSLLAEATIDALNALRACPEQEHFKELLRFVEQNFYKTPFLKHHLNQFREHPPEIVRKLLGLIENQQPFSISFPSPNSVAPPTIYEVVYGRIERKGLKCRVAEAVALDNAPKELWENIDLSFELLEKAQIATSPLSWDTRGLALMEIEFLLYGAIAHNYAPHPSDVRSDEWTNLDHCPARRVVRRVNDWSAVRQEMLGYGRFCKVASPRTAVALLSRELGLAYSMSEKVNP